MSSIEELARIGISIMELIDSLHVKACYVDSRIASKVWRICDAMREVMAEIEDLLKEEATQERWQDLNGA